MNERNTTIIRGIAFLLFVGIIGCGVYLAMADKPFGFDLSHKGMSARIDALGPWRGVGIMVLMVLHSFVPFPAEVVTFLAGKHLGLFWGTVYSWSGAMLGAVMAFALSRAFGRSFVQAMLPARMREGLASWSTSKSTSALLIARFIPIIAFNLINYAAGLTNVRWWTFIWTTGLGILPLTVLFVSLGERMQDATWWDWAEFAAVAVVLSVVVQVGLRYARKRGWIEG
jgi:uncharacterized membrane protein YdjX (TVP38/TMEM64 family)